MSVADQKHGVEGVLWYQGMSRVCPGCHQTSPGEARKGGCIRDPDAEHRTSNIEHPPSNEVKPPEAAQSHAWAQAAHRAQAFASAVLTTPCPPARSRRGAESFAVDVIQNFLFHLARRQYVSPRFFFALASEKPQVMPGLEQHRLGLTLDLFEQ